MANLTRRSFLGTAAGAALLPGVPAASATGHAPSAARASASVQRVMPRFPAGFLWGVSASAFQIEGAVRTDGRGPSVWDTFSHQSGRIAGGATADVACDHYHRYREDVRLMRRLGVGAYRFSISWPRVQPGGSGTANAHGLDFYSRLIDELLAAGIEPVPTLYHWDLPQALQDAGGWQSRDTAQRFADYAQLVGARLGDRVPRWITHNETFEHHLLGHVVGVHAPGLTLGLQSFAVAHHLLLSHGLAVQALRAAARRPAQIGIAQSLSTERPQDAERDATAVQVTNLFHWGLHIDPLLLGRYPVQLAELGLDMSAARSADTATIAQPLDFLGINYYNPQYVRAAPEGSALPAEEAPPPAQFERTEMGWPVDPQGLTELMLALRERYGSSLPPIVITENGAAFRESVATGAIHDARRIAYLDSHVRALHAAMSAGADVRGYFVWSILDNFEWAEGYRPRFGLVHVDYRTLARTPKDSWYWYRDLISAQRRRAATGAAS